MKKSFLIVIALCVFASTFVFAASEGSAMVLKIVRALSSTDDTGPSETAAMYEDVSNQMVLIRNRSQPVGVVVVEFFGTGVENTTGNYCIEFSKGPNSPVEYACHGTFTLGKSTDAAGNRWADVIAISGSGWIRTPWPVLGTHYNMGTGAVVGAGIGKLVIDSCEYNYIRVKMEKGTCTSVGAGIHNFK